MFKFYNIRTHRQNMFATKSFLRIVILTCDKIQKYTKEYFKN